MDLALTWCRLMVRPAAGSGTAVPLLGRREGCVNKVGAGAPMRGLGMSMCKAESPLATSGLSPWQAGDRTAGRPLLSPPC